ncbi:hypothetical protein DRQ53_15465 [bacterium]|nr:MAG: hypothetical protein DRQ53_15465 [bacterium]
MSGQFAAYETAFTRLSRVQCRSLLITEGFIDPGFVWPEIEDRRNWRSVLHALYRNDGLFDPEIPLNEHLAFDTNGAWPRGVFIKDGQHWSPPQVSAYFANSYGANPVEYLANFFGRPEAERLSALPTPQTIASEAGYQGDFVVMTNKPFREPNGPVSDRFSLALKAACTNPTSGWVDQMTSPVPPGDRLNQVKIVPNGGEIDDVKRNFENRWFLFGATQYHSDGESKAPTVDSIDINGLMALQRTDGSFAGFYTGDQVVLLDVSSIRRGMKVLSVTDDLIITDGTFKAFTDGRVISCADQIAGFCTHYDTATQVATFEPRLARVPRHHQHVGNIGQSDADDGKKRDIELLAQMLVDTPFESRQLVMNASLGVESDASRPLKYSDVSGYGVGTLRWTNTRKSAITWRGFSTNFGSE